MKDSKFLEDLFFLDIETVPCEADYAQLSERMQVLWDKKSTFMQKEKENSASALFFEKGAIYAEFGKIICISIGVFYFNAEKEVCFRVKNIAHHQEREILLQLQEILLKRQKTHTIRLVAHNGKEFDFPYISRRMLVHQIDVPSCLDVRGKKPWEITHLDTMELWRFGDYKAFTSLDLLAAVFDLPTSKDDMDGSKVAHVYYHEKNLPKIAHYCNKDVMLTAQIFLRLHNLPILKSENIFIVA